MVSVAQIIYSIQTLLKNHSKEAMGHFGNELAKALTPYGIPDHTGNPMLEAATSYMIATLNPKISNADRSFSKDILVHVSQALKIRNGLIAKKLNGDGTQNSDEITHDDMIGLAVISPFHSKFILWELLGNKKYMCSQWSNQSYIYWSGFVRPVDYQIIRLLSEGRTSLYGSLLITLNYLIQSLSFKSTSSTRLAWIKAHTLILYRGRLLDPMIKFSISFYLKRLKKYGGISKILASYYNNNEHLHVQYTKDL